MKKHENYKELIWALAKTDFKLRYHGSALGYLWAILKPLLMFTILNFVFSSLFNPRGTGNEYYSLQLLLGIILFNFFSTGIGSTTRSSPWSEQEYKDKASKERHNACLVINTIFISFFICLLLLLLFFLPYGIGYSLA